MSRKILSIACAAAMVLSLAACGDKKVDEPMDLTPSSSAVESQPETSEPETSSEPEMEVQPTVISDMNIYDCERLEFNVETVGIKFAEALQGSTHNVLYMADTIEIPVMTKAEGAVNHMIYNIVLSDVDLEEKTPVTTIGETRVYVDSYLEEFPIDLITFSEPIEGIDDEDTNADDATSADDAAVDETGATVDETGADVTDEPTTADLSIAVSSAPAESEVPAEPSSAAQ